MDIKSSYKHPSMHYGDILRLLAWITKPKRIVEFGILEGFSLRHLLEGASPSCEVYAYDIFEQFNGNAAKQTVKDKFPEPNVKIQHGNFYTQHESFADESIDILHIDIANDGATYKFAVENYMRKVSKGGFMVLEGGSKERDNIGWMLKYNKESIQSFLTSLSSEYRYKVLEPFPSMTILQRT